MVSTPSRRTRGGGRAGEHFHDEERGTTITPTSTTAHSSNMTSPSAAASSGTRRGTSGRSAGTTGNGMGRYRQIMDVTGMTNGISMMNHHVDDIAIDTNLTTLEEYQKSVEIMTRQRRWIRCLSILALALAIDVIFLSIKLTKNNKEMETIVTEQQQQQQQQQQQEEEQQQEIQNNQSNSSSDSSMNATTTTTTTTTSSRFRLSVPPNWLPLPTNDQVITRIAFGSSSSQYMPQPYWDTVVRFQPDLLILGGDNVYGDCSSSHHRRRQEEEEGEDIITTTTCEELQDAYSNWTQHASFQGAIERFPIIATLDDHDYGLQHADKTNPYKRQAKYLFHEFFHHLETVVPPKEEEDDDEDDDDGVFQEYTWGPPGNRVQVILLDTRYHRDPFSPNTDYDPETALAAAAAGAGAGAVAADPKNVTTPPQQQHPTLPPPPPPLLVPPKAPYKPSTASNQQMLSSQQWEWLTEVIQKPDIQIRFLVSSIQILNDGTGYESWRQLPKERERLYNLLRKECTSPIYLLSGDRYMGGFYQYDFDDDDDDDESDAINESISGFTAATTPTATTNNNNNNNMINMTTATTTIARSTTTPRDDDDDGENSSSSRLPSSPYSSLMEVTASSWTHTIPYGAYDDCFDSITCDEIDPNRIGDFVRENNFATIEIDWENGTAAISLRRAETPPAYLYHGQENHKNIASTGQILQSRSFQFLP